VGDEALYDRYRAAVAAAATPQERRRFLLGLGSFRTRAARERTLAAVLTPEIPTQDVAFLLMRLLANPAARGETWKFMTRKWAAPDRRSDGAPAPVLRRAGPRAPPAGGPRASLSRRDAQHPQPAQVQGGAGNGPFVARFVTPRHMKRRKPIAYLLPACR